MADQPVEPAIKKLDLTIARLRLLLADVSAREQANAAQQRTFREQREKLITFSLYGDSTLDSVLNMLADLDEKLARVDSTARALEAVRTRGAAELESLQLTKGIEEARALLAQLQQRQAEAVGPAGALSPAQVQAEIARLQALINEASERAAHNIERASLERVARRG